MSTPLETMVQQALCNQLDVDTYDRLDRDRADSNLAGALAFDLARQMADNPTGEWNPLSPRVRELEHALQQAEGRCASLEREHADELFRVNEQHRREIQTQAEQRRWNGLVHGH